MPGATVAIGAVPLVAGPSAAVTVIAARPLAVPAGTWKLTCPGAAKKSWPWRLVPAESFTLTVVPLGLAATARCAPKTVAMESAAMGAPALKLAPFTVLMAGGGPLGGA